MVVHTGQWPVGRLESRRSRSYQMDYPTALLSVYTIEWELISKLYE